MKKTENSKKKIAYALIHGNCNNWKKIDISVNDSNDNSDEIQSSDVISDIASTERSFTKFNEIITKKCESLDLNFDNCGGESVIECTLAIIKPEAMEFRNSIKKRIIDEGFEICTERILNVTPEQASEFYCNEYGKLHFPFLTVYLASGPINVMVLAKNEGVKGWRRVMGPKDVS